MDRTNRRPLNILVGCEESQAVTIELRKLGHNAFSCDLQDSSGGHPEWHLKMDVLKALVMKPWDMFIAFPDCTYLSVSGLHWNGRIEGRAEKTEQALQFVCDIVNKAMSMKIRDIAIENPVGCISTRIYKHYEGMNNTFTLKVSPTKTTNGLKHTQTIQPYNFGHDASKRTCLWLFGNLKPLKPTEYIQPRLIDGKKRWANQTDSGQNKLGPSEERAKIRSKTYPGIAKAIAEQWG